MQRASLGVMFRYAMTIDGANISKALGSLGGQS